MFRAKEQDTPASENNAAPRPSVAAVSSHPPVNPQ
jgi:hypothetical protein